MTQYIQSLYAPRSTNKHHIDMDSDDIDTDSYRNNIKVGICFKRFIIKIKNKWVNLEFKYKMGFKVFQKKKKYTYQVINRLNKRGQEKVNNITIPITSYLVMRVGFCTISDRNSPMEKIFLRVLSGRSTTITPSADQHRLTPKC